MNVVIDERRRVPRTGRSLGAALVALAGIVVCVVQIGVAATVILVSLGMIAFVSLLRFYPTLYRRRRLQAAVGGVELVAEASRDGRPGSISFFSDRLEWHARDESEPLSIAKADVDTAHLSRVSPLVKATRTRLEMKNGNDVNFTVTAPLDDVEHALRQ